MQIQLDFRIVRKDGNIRWIGHVCQTVFDDQGNPLGRRCSNRDITDEKNIHETLRVNEHFLNSILSSTPNLIYIFDIVENRNIYANKEVTKFLGYQAEEIKAMGSRLFEHILHPDNMEAVAKHHNKCSKAKENEILELAYRMKHADGKWRWLRSRDMPYVRDSKGKVCQILGTTEDITEQKTVIQNLLEKDEQLKLSETMYR